VEWVRLPRLEPGSGFFDHLRDAGDLELLARHLADPGVSRRTRRRIVRAIATMAPGGGRANAFSGAVDPGTIAHLGPLLEADGDPVVRRWAAFGLRRTSDPRAVKPLLRALSDPDPATRSHAILGLGELGAREAVDPLVALLEDKRCAPLAATALARIRDERAIPHLQSAATGARGFERVRVEQALFELEEGVGLRR
jgi:HEAT repeat protein